MQDIHHVTALDWVADEANYMQVFTCMSNNLKNHLRFDSSWWIDFGAEILTSRQEFRYLYRPSDYLTALCDCYGRRIQPVDAGSEQRHSHRFMVRYRIAAQSAEVF
jgi:hypothetical protein